MDLLPSEQVALDFVSGIGLDRASRILTAIIKRFDRRYKRACEACFSSINRDCINSTPLELELSHRIKIGMTLLTPSDTPAACHDRIMARRAQRKAEREAKKKQLAA